MTYQFPENFLWGSATSGPQSEGYGAKAHDSIWDSWFKAESNKFFNQVGPEKSSNFFYDFKKDIKIMKSIGHNSFRSSIQWSRLIDNFETASINPAGAQFYGAVIDALLAEGIKPIFALFHFDMPTELQARGGWANREVVTLYQRYAKAAFTLFGDRITCWATFNEPVVIAEGGYLYHFHYPLELSFKKAVQVAYHLNLASALAIKEYRSLKYDGEIGIILNLTPSYPRDLHNRDDVAAAYLADLIFNRSFLDPAIKGHFPNDLISFLEDHALMPLTTLHDLTTIRCYTIDFLGVNYYQPRRIKAKESPLPLHLSPETFFDHYDMPHKVMNPYRGWEIYHKGIYDIAKNIQENYGNISWMVSENGIGVENEERFIEGGGVVDNYRIAFVTEHLKWLHRAISEGSNCFGYHMWCFVDSWSWLNSFKNRYGFISLDLVTGQKTIKKSGRWFKSVAEDHGFSD